MDQRIDERSPTGRDPDGPGGNDGDRGDGGTRDGSALSERDRAVLDFEGSWWLHPGSKDSAIRDALGMSATRYYQAIRRLMDDPAAMEYAPLTVRRLLRMRQARLAQIADRVRRGSSG
ncbi:MAG TPA: DUF3263 domain-containing protein [Acidimicrobiia bacterium]